MTKIKTSLTRRQFLKISAATAGVVIAGNVIKEISPTFVKASTKAASATENETKFGACRTCHRTYCATKYKVEAGVVTQVEGDDRSPWNKGRLCVRGNAVLMQLYNPYRVKAPLKRTNPEKGLDVDPMWMEISWDEALDTVAKKLIEIREDDTRKLIYSTGFGADYSLLSTTFGRAFGTTSDARSTGSMCSVHWPSQLMIGASNQVPDPEYAKYIIMIGRSLGLSAGHGEPSCMDMTDAVQKGLKFVSIDPRCGVEASKGEWIPIRPGTELSFVLSMAHVILHELNTFDEWFVKNRTSGPYLVDEKGDYFKDIESGKPLIMDIVDQKVKTFDDESIQDYALENSFQIDGQKVQPVFSVLKEHLKQYTPEWAEEISTVDANTIRRIAKEYVEAASIGMTINIDGTTFPYRPVGIFTGRGCTNHYDGHIAAWFALVINALVGCLDVPGGVQGQELGKLLEPDENGTVRPSPGHGSSLTYDFNFPPENLNAVEFFPFGFSQGFRVVDGILDPEKYHIDFQPTAMLTYGQNLYTKGVEPDRVTEAQKRLSFLATISYHLDEHAAFADIVFPESSVLEWTFFKDITERKFWGDAKRFFGAIVHQPIIPPMYQSRQGDDILIELAERVGFLYGERGLNSMVNKSLKDEYQLVLDEKYSIHEIVDRSLRSKHGPDKGLEYFKTVGFIAKERKPAEVYNSFHFPGNSTRHPIYNTTLKNVGENLLTNLKEAGISHPDWDEDEIRFYYQPLPTWKPTPYYTGREGFNFYAVVWKVPPLLFDISNTNSNPYLQEVMAETPIFGKLLINPEKAAMEGFNDGDQVWVENMFGSKIGPVQIKITELVHKDVAGVASGLARQAPGMNPIAGNGIAFNPLLTSKGEYLDIITAAFDNGPRVKVYKA